jgi:hypothetical protein
LSQQTSAYLILILIVVLMLVLAFFLSTYLMKRALRAVLKMFRDNHALTPETAQFAQDMGMKKKGLLSFGGLRDYRPSVLQFMMKQDIVQATQEGKLFLSEEALGRSGMEAKIINRNR